MTQLADGPESALATPEIDVGREVIIATTNLLVRFGPDAFVRRHDAYAAAFRIERDIPWMIQDEGDRNHSSAVLRTRDVTTANDGSFRMVICGASLGAAERAEGELLELVRESPE